MNDEGVPVRFRLPMELHETLVALARQALRTPNAQAEWLIRELLIAERQETADTVMRTEDA